MNTNIYGGELARRIDLHTELLEEDAAAKAHRDRAALAIDEAEAQDVAVEAAARLAGRKDAREPAAGAVAAHDAELAEREAQVTAVAVIQSVDSVVEEMRRPEYTERLQKADDSHAKAALNALAKLDAELAALEEVRASRLWLGKHVSGTRLPSLTAHSVFTGDTKPNGEPRRAADLTQYVRDALLPPVNTADQRTYVPTQALPAGAIAPTGGLSQAARRSWEDSRAGWSEMLRPEKDDQLAPAQS